MRVKKTGKGKGIVDITEADHQAQLARIKDEDAVLKPGRYRYERGGFKCRHPDYAPETSKVKISILLDADVLAYSRPRRTASCRALPNANQSGVAPTDGA